MVRRMWVGWLPVVLGLVLTGSVFAQDDQAAVDRAAAETLFKEGVALLEEGQLEAACLKLSESFRLAGGLGARFKLAECQERRGMLASAWSSFLAVAAATKLAGQPARSDLAQQRADALEPRLTRLRIEVVAPVAGLHIARSGSKVGRAQWQAAMPVDPGSYTITASAPGHHPWTHRVEVHGEGSTAAVSVPALAAVPAPPAPPPPTAPPLEGEVAPADSPQGVIGLIIASVGVAGLAVGGAFAAVAVSKHDEQQQYCDDTGCDDQGIALNQDARTAGNVSTVAVIAGSALLVGGFVVWLTAPSEEGPDIAAGLTASPFGPSVTLGARF
ncbi:MAG: hypothetical protein JRI68_11055 [Deltaproteobacteria bacterium]|nr:hypothetical protein [Deltaproteobacteria bacterium]